MRSRVRPSRLASRLGREVEHDDQVGLEPRGRQLVQLSDLGDAEPAPDALVRERRRHEPVADHPGAALERGTHDLCDVLGPVRGHQQCLGDRVDRAGLVEQQRAQARTERGRAGLERRDHLMARASQPGREQLHLRALARRVTALENDEASDRAHAFPLSESVACPGVRVERGVDRVVALGLPPRVARPDPGRERDQPTAPQRDAHARERVARAAEVDEPVTRELIHEPVPEVGPQR